MGANSPFKSDGRELRVQKKDHLTVEQLAVDFFRTAMGETGPCEELEKVQL